MILQRANTPNLVGCRPLKVRPVPTVQARPNHPRSSELVKDELRAVIRQLCAGERPWPLYLWSRETGTGKTSAALALLDRAAKLFECWSVSQDVRDFDNGFIDFAEMPRFLRAAEKKQYRYHHHGSGGPLTDSHLWNIVRNAPLIVLDDLRRPGEKELSLGHDHYGCVKRVLDERVGLPLVITSNIRPYGDGALNELVSVFDDRVADRIHAGTLFQLAGESRRQRPPSSEG